MNKSLDSLSMPKGGFAILALDQRESLRQMLAEGQRKVLVLQLIQLALAGHLDFQLEELSGQIQLSQQIQKKSIQVDS